MIKSIKWRFVIIYVVLVIIVMTISGSLVIWLTNSNAESEMKDGLKEAVDQITTYVIVDSTTTIEEIEEDLRTVINNYGELYKSKRIYLLDSTGAIVFSTTAHENPLDYSYYPQVVGALHNMKVEELDKVEINGEEESYRGFAENIILNGEVAFVVYAIASTQSANAMQNSIITVIIIAMVSAIFISSILGSFFASFITRPITALSQKARDMASGNLESSINVYSDDEIGELSRNFNIMALSLNETLREISFEKNKLEIVFAHMTDGILVFDKDGELIHHNPASINMLHVNDAMVFEDVFAPYFNNSFLDIVRRIRDNDEIVQHIIYEDGKYYNIGLAKYLDRQDKIMGVICVIQDITEHKKLEEMQKEFVANVSHELRTPLTNIKSYAETLLDGAASEPEIADRFLTVINQEADRMTALVQDLLDLSKLDNQQTKFVMKDINLNYLVENSVEKHILQAEKKEQNLTFHKPSHTYKVFGDPNRIEQVIKNIVSNAVKYSQNKDSIDVWIKEDKKYVVLICKDTGIGIPKEDVDRIFERFYRVDKARSREMGGTGLGLAIAKEIMEHHGGKITVESTLNEGTTFKLYFPKNGK